MKGIIALNLKVYDLSYSKGIELVEVSKTVSEETGVRVIVAPPSAMLAAGADKYDDVFAQSCELGLGASTGTNPLEGMPLIGVIGTLVNHSEKKIKLNEIAKLVEGAKKLKVGEKSFETIVCTASNFESKAVAVFRPNYVAVEPPELIGSGISVSTAQPEVVESSVAMVKDLEKEVKVLCGAGISNGDDVKKAMELGADGVLLASAYVKAKSPYAFLQELAGNV